MGNSSSNSSKVRQKSETMEFNGKSKKDVSKSKSMMEITPKSNAATTHATSSSVPSVTSSNSKRQKSVASIERREGSAKSTKSSNGISRQKSMRKDVTPHPISPGGREIISQCFDNPHSEFANKVLQRIFEKRVDYQRFIMQLGKDRSVLINSRLKELIEDVVAKIHDPEYIENVSKQYGEEHVELKQFGFKPDFWVAIADAMTLEGVILDMASHQPADTVSAWSSLVTIIFSAVRDGYYSELRRHRISSRKNLRTQNTIDSREDPDTFETDNGSIGSCQMNQSMLLTGSQRRVSAYSMESTSIRASPINAPTRRPIFE